MCAFCIECASQPKLALSLPIKGPSYCRLTVRRRPKERPKTIDIFPWQPYNKNTNTVYMTGQREVPRAWCNIINP